MQPFKVEFLRRQSKEMSQSSSSLARGQRRDTRQNKTISN
ncbi:hypothetical protein NC653_026128 [Populus alba x Populus x berolinensis]|uniref:Uncharacterized protein n=1 Tax=Populus alba x Populus x berolinensis TaxID=444605 RepID=A0AAD6MCW4_9ROSI|nr:hypothetical protein NC653_026128 [Populus alba x Populus x berolinensis]